MSYPDTLAFRRFEIARELALSGHFRQWRQVREALLASPDIALNDAALTFDDPLNGAEIDRMWYARQKP